VATKGSKLFISIFYLIQIWANKIKGVGSVGCRVVYFRSMKKGRLFFKKKERGQIIQ
jgi:hypothetical protein